MAKSVLLPLLTLCFTGVKQWRDIGVSDVAATQDGQQGELSCVKDNGGTTTHNITATGSYTIKCPQNTSLTPKPTTAAPDAEVFRTPDGAETSKCSISKILQGACCGTKNEQGGDVVLKIPQLPNATTQFFLHCMKDAPKEKECTIAVVVAAAPRLGPGACSTPGFRMRLGIESKDEVATFSCGDGRTLQPAVFQQKAYDESCTKEVELPANLKVAQSSGAYTVALTGPLNQNTTLCYVCQKNANGVTDKCEVSVSISGSAVSEALSVGAAARAAAAVGLALVAIVVLPVW